MSVNYQLKNKFSNRLGIRRRTAEALSDFLPFLISGCRSFHRQLINSCSSIQELKQYHGHIIVNGLSQDLLLFTKLISLASSLGHTMDYARTLFDTVPDPDAFMYNALIRGYADLGPCECALRLYQRMHYLGLLPDNFTFPFVIRSCAVLSALEEGKEVHCNVIKNGLDSNVFVQSSLVSMYAQTGETSSSELVFEGIVVQNVVSWTAMIAGNVQNGFFKEALSVFKRMVGSGTKPNSVTLVSVLPALAGLEFLKTGELIHGYSIKLGLDSDISFVNSLIALYGKCRNVGIARSLFERMKTRNLVSWNAIIAVYEQNENGNEAIKLFRRMQTQKVKFDYITMVSVISACACLGALNIGKWVHELVKRKGLDSNSSVANALIDMHAKCGSIDLAKTLFDKLPNRSVVSWSAMIGAYAAHGHAKEALSLFSKMLEECVRPNAFTFTSVLTACRHSGLVDDGMQHYTSMIKEHLIAPSVEHCACIVDLLGRAGRLVEAYNFIQNMPVEPDVGVWGALLAACRTHSDVELAELVADNLSELDPQTVAFDVLMLNIYAEAGKWDGVRKLRKLMEEKELKRIPGHSLVEVNHRFRTFRAGHRLGTP